LVGCFGTFASSIEQAHVDIKLSHSDPGSFRPFNDFRGLRTAAPGRGFFWISLCETQEWRQPTQVRRPGSDTLVSDTFIPAHTRAESEDQRELGLCVARLRIDGDDVALDRKAALQPGWYAPQFAQDAFARRWTKGVAWLPTGARIVIVDLAGFGYYWRMPEGNVAALFA